ncbi:hypothetical protein CVAR292_01932 [Corynebacterium variabile]|uniref:Uncharacterized protein n=1 Tax=Corynebacterium variabile TaxID=1727 RepID=A0A0X2NM71_9CORY|nr:hypothetical protein CVAR292_01932 [Corynebacterium variabile]
MSPARSPYPDRRIPVSEAFLGLPLPDGILPDARADTDQRHPALTDGETTCPDGLVEEVLWGLLHGLTAPVTGRAAGPAGASEVQRA